MSENALPAGTIITPVGRITYSADVVATIATLAVSTVEGVNPAKKSRGVRLEMEADAVEVYLEVVIRMGEVLKEVCAQVQSSVEQAIDTMTNLKVRAVHVTVTGIAA